MLKSTLTFTVLIIFNGVVGDVNVDYSLEKKDGVQLEETKGENHKFIEENDVVILTKENFHDYINSRPLVLVEFYSPWCESCKIFETEYSEASFKLKKENGIALTKIDSTKDVEIANEFEIKRFPTIVLFINGKKKEQYEGKFTSYEIMDYVRINMDPNWRPLPSQVITLTSTDFRQMVTNFKLSLVLFYDPSCKFCQELRPEYEAAARTLIDHGIPVAQVDGIAEKALADAYRVTRFPTFKLFRKGRAFEYKGPRDHRGIVDFMKDQLNKPASKLVANLAEMKSGLNRMETTILGFFESEETDLFQEFLEAANDFRGVFTCMHTFDPNAPNYFNASENSVVVYQPEIFHSEFEKSFQEYDRENGNADEIMEFVKFHSVPLVGQRTKKNEAYKYSSKPLVVVYYDVNFSHNYVKATQIIRKKVLSVANIYKETNIRFALSNEEEFKEELNALGFQDSNEDVKIAAYDQKLKFRMEPTDDLDVDEFKTFIGGLISGKGKAYYRSQPVPKVQEGPVEVVVADNLVDRVLRNGKDVLIEFYAPRCPICKKLEPEYKKLAKFMKKENPNLMVAKMDGTANDIHSIFGEVKESPSIFFLSVDRKDKPIRYSGGDFSYKALKGFVEKHSSVFLTDEELELL